MVTFYHIHASFVKLKKIIKSTRNIYSNAVWQPQYYHKFSMNIQRGLKFIEIANIIPKEKKNVYEDEIAVWLFLETILLISISWFPSSSISTIADIEIYLSWMPPNVKKFNSALCFQTSVSNFVINNFFFFLQSYRIFACMRKRTFPHMIKIKIACKRLRSIRRDTKFFVIYFVSWSETFHTQT